MSKILRLFAGLAVIYALAGGAEAHALLLAFKVEREEVMLRYNGRVDVARSRLTLFNNDGTLRQKLDCAAGGDPATLKSNLGGIAAGTYILRWEVLSVDGHISRGELPLVLPAP
jgi:methionine-rich copper-binding protein CopC